MDPLKLRQAGPNDAEALLPLIQALFAFEGVVQPPHRISASLETLLTQPSLGGAWIFELGAEIAGYAVVTFGYDVEYGGRDAWVTDFYVLPEPQGQGLGRQAMELLEQEAKRLGVQALHLQVRESNVRALRLYEARGFTRVPRTCMTKQLGTGP